MFSKNSNIICAAGCMLVCGVSGLILPAISADQKQKSKNVSTEKNSKPVAKIKKTVKPYKGKLTVKQSITLGKTLYNQYQCYDCHSIAGKGC
ncbi:MAG TPA: hypothetical protein PKZ32_12625, partial [Candidatus Melainabacteria bacterium]|nr:hypothetical protein [Candidatus Melainabacteria bacterium]